MQYSAVYTKRFSILKLQKTKTSLIMDIAKISKLLYVEVFYQLSPMLIARRSWVSSSLYIETHCSICKRNLPPTFNVRRLWDLINVFYHCSMEKF